MCNPTYALLAVNVASAGLKYQAGKQQQEAAYNAQKRRNEIDPNKSARIVKAQVHSLASHPVVA